MHTCVYTRNHHPHIGFCCWQYYRLTCTQSHPPLMHWFSINTSTVHALSTDSANLSFFKITAAVVFNFLIVNLHSTVVYSRMEGRGLFILGMILYSLGVMNQAYKLRLSLPEPHTCQSRGTRWKTQWNTTIFLTSQSTTACMMASTWWAYLGQTCLFAIETGKYIQVVHNGADHWLVVTNIWVPRDGVVRVYYSLYKHLTTSTELQIASIVNILKFQ